MGQQGGGGVCRCGKEAQVRKVSTSQPAHAYYAEKYIF